MRLRSVVQLSTMRSHHVHKGDISVLIGDDSLTLLHSVTTQDFQNLSESHTQTCCILDVNGRIEDRIVVWNLGDQVALLHMKGRASSTRELLVRSKSWKQNVDVIALDEGFSALFTEVEGEHVVNRVEQQDSIYFTIVETLGTLEMIHLGPSLDIEILSKNLIEQGSNLRDSSEEDLYRIKRGHVTSSGFEIHRPIPLEVALEADISFTKGCYIGQEIIARMDARDALARISVTVECDSEVPTGRHSLEGGGRIIVMSTVEESGSWWSMCLVHPDIAHEGAVLHIKPDETESVESNIRNIWKYIQPT